jgi:hypothetical protein
MNNNKYSLLYSISLYMFLSPNLPYFILVIFEKFCL